MSIADNNLVKIIDAAHKRKAAENALKAEVIKYQIKSKIDSNAKMEQTRNEMALKQQQERIDNPQRYTPEQAYLKRRFMEENPLAALAIPEAGAVAPNENIGIQFPSDEIVRDPKTQTFRQQPLTGDRQGELLLSKVDQMLAEGKTPHPAVMKLANIVRNNLRIKAENKAAGIKPPKPMSNSYTGADAKLVSQAESLTSKLESLKSMVGTKAENYLPFGGFTKEGQEFQTLRDDIKSTLLYLRSGAAVTPQEYKRLSNLLPQLMRLKEVDKSQIDRFISEFQAITDRIKQGRKYDENTGKFVGGETNSNNVVNSDSVDWESAPDGATATDPDGNTWTKTDGEWVQETN